MTKPHVMQKVLTDGHYWNTQCSCGMYMRGITLHDLEDAFWKHPQLVRSNEWNRAEMIEL